MRLAYIAGPYRAPNKWAIEQNIRKAECLALEVWRNGLACLCPHMNSRHFDGAAPDEVWLAGGLEMLRRCDAVLLVQGWEDSEGTRREIQEAGLYGIPVFKNIEELRTWDRIK